jgi:RNA polymerase sigma-70 factor, ECF subfamily
VLDDATIRAFLMDDYPRLVNAVSLVAGSLPAAEDAVQEALVRAWTRSARGERIDSLANWVAAVALNLSRSGWRRARAERRAKDRLGQLPPPAPSEEAHLDLQRALAALPRRQREVAVLRYLLELSTKETAATLRIGEGTVKNSLAKARTALSVALGVEYAEADDLEVNDVED